MKPVALVAECSKKVGSGHAVELAHIARSLGRTPRAVFLDARTPAALRARFSSARTFRSWEALAAELARLRIPSAFLNVLKLSRAAVAAFKKRGIRVGALTVAGPVPRGLAFHRRGLSCLPLAPEYARLSRRARRHHGPIKNLLIVMGGTDASGSTALLVRRLAGRYPKIVKHVVQGPNFARPRALAAALKRAEDRTFRLHRAPTSLAPLMRRCDAALTLGSDTSLELACLGTPALLFHEAPHERRQARYLSKKGCGIFLGAAAQASAAKIDHALSRLADPKFRERAARAGRRLVDGRGGERLAADIEKFLRG